MTKKGVPENDLFDLKADLQPAEHQRTIAAAFANTRGGFLVFGITNDREVVGVRNAELPRDFGAKLRQGLDPSISYQFGTPLEVAPGQRIFICHIESSRRGPHAVFIDGFWRFYKRTPSGNNEPMTFEEIRSAFLDAGRRRSELAWLVAEVGRIRERGYTINVESSADRYTLDLLSTRLDSGQLKTLLLTVFEYIRGSPSLVKGLQELAERCMKVDRALHAMEELELRPRDRSYSGSRGDGRALIRVHAPEIVMLADRLLRELKEVAA